MSEPQPGGVPTSPAPAAPHPARASWHRRRSTHIAAALVVLLIVAVLVVRKHKGAPAAADADVTPAAAIHAATTHLGNMGVYVEALGTVTPAATVNLYSQVNGNVDAVHYTEGQMVKRGDPLLDIDARGYQAQLQQAEGTLQHDRALLAQAQMDLARYREASGQQAIARQTYEDQRLSVEQYRGTVKNDEGQVKYAQVQLAYCHIVAPIAGRIGLRLVDPGNVVFSGASSPIAVITQLQPITVVFNVAEDNLAQVHDEIFRRASLPIDIYDRSQQHKIASGKLLTLDNQVDTATGTVRFRGQFDNANLALYPNQFVNARLLVKTLNNVVLVPTAAIQRNGTQAFVYVVSGGAVQARNLVELASEANQAAVSGIAAGEVVTTTSFDKLQDGAKVTIENDAPAAPDPAASATSATSAAAAASAASATSAAAASSASQPRAGAAQAGQPS
jgi:multidrug efflux system membrane fusion protein